MPSLPDRRLRQLTGYLLLAVLVGLDLLIFKLNALDPYRLATRGLETTGVVLTKYAGSSSWHGMTRSFSLSYEFTLAGQRYHHAQQISPNEFAHLRRGAPFTSPTYPPTQHQRPDHLPQPAPAPSPTAPSSSP